MAATTDCSAKISNTGAGAEALAYNQVAGGALGGQAYAGWAGGLPHAAPSAPLWAALLFRKNVTSYFVAGVIWRGVHGEDVKVAEAGEKRVALVIGNAAYKHASMLMNPANDAGAIGAALTRLGFTGTKPQLNFDCNGLRRALHAFSAEAAHHRNSIP